MINFLLLLVILLCATYFINYFLIQSFLGFRWRIFVAPGVILHELSHALACLLTGAKIVKISFFDKDGGSVKHHPSFIPVLGPVIISLAPLVVGILVFYLLASKIQLADSLDLSAMYFNLKTIIISVNWHSWFNLLAIYLLLSVAVTMTPSWQDLRNMLIPVAVLGGILYLVLRFTSLNIHRFDTVFSSLSLMLNMVIFILAICLVLSFILYAFSKIVLRK